MRDDSPGISRLFAFSDGSKDGDFLANLLDSGPFGHLPESFTHYLFVTHNAIVPHAYG